MRKNHKKTNVSILLFIFCALVGASILFRFTGEISIEKDISFEKNITSLPEGIKQSKSWTNFTEIHITGGDWSTVENYDWVQGDGSWSNPYIIENITIDASSSSTGSGIIIEDSNDFYFIIQNCNISNAGSGFDYAGIKLLNTNRGKILNNNCSNNLGAGIYLYNSDNNTIAGNTADFNDDFDHQGSGINIDGGSDNNIIYKNHCFNNRRDGIILYQGSSGNNVTFNNCSENGRVGVMLLNYVSNNIIAYNNLAQNGVDQPTKAGIHVESSDGNYLLYNNVSNGKPSARGISLLQANDHTIIGNIANSNQGNGIYINGNPSPWTSSNNYIADNIVKNNTGHGIYLYGDVCDGNTVFNNTVLNNTGSGIILQTASTNTIHYNTAKDNDNYDIYLTSASNYNDIIYYNTSVDSFYISGDCIGNTIQELFLEEPNINDDNDDNDDDDDDDDDNSLDEAEGEYESPIMIIIFIIVVGSIVTIIGYTVKTQKKKKSVPRKSSLKNKAAIKRKRLMEAKTTTQSKKALVPSKLKDKKKQSLKESPKALTAEERAELAKTEKEVGVAKQKFICLVHRGSLHGSTIYLCKHCDSFYCERCAKVLKLKGESCWTCGNEIDLQVTEQDRKELLKKSATDLVEEIIQEKELLKEFIESEKKLEDVPELRKDLFGVFTPEELNKIDLLDFTVDEKKQFIKEFISLDEESRKTYLDDLLQK